MQLALKFGTKVKKITYKKTKLTFYALSKVGNWNGLQKLRLHLVHITNSKFFVVIKDLLNQSNNYFVLFDTKVIWFTYYNLTFCKRMQNMVPQIMLKENFSTLKMILLQKKSSHGIDTMIKFWCIFQRNFALYIESNYLSYFLLFYTTIYPNGLCTRGLMAKCNISLTGKFFDKSFTGI